MKEDFTWGVATSAYQIEGGRFEDGKVDSIWDTFSDAGHIADSGDVTCDHFHRYPEDIALMADLGVDAYRMSLAWTRIIDSDGKVNQAGLRFYDQIIDGLIAANITPWVTLYHWDLPQALEDAGGWPDRSIVDTFDAYAAVTARHFGDRVKHWITINEPWVAAILGYRQGSFAPGRTSMPDALAAAHHMLLAHGRAAATIRRHVPDARVGLALDCQPPKPTTSSPADLRATRHFDGFKNRWFLDPVFGLGYPSDMLAAYTDRGYITSASPDWLYPGDKDIIAAELDFIGINYYTSASISAGAEEDGSSGVAPTPNPPPGYTEMGWAIDPVAFAQFLARLHETYQPKSIVITENGVSFSDGPDAAGRIADTRRQAYLRQHIEALEKAAAGGVPIDGYFIWSLLDNLEWTSGFSQRFGIVYVDHATQKRTPKDSFRWYQERIARQRIDAHLPYSQGETSPS